jgi:type II secretory pathway pseudopilin PulG
MKPIQPFSATTERPEAERGSALLLSILVLIVLAAIVFQLYITTNTDARVARNDVALVTMDQAIESTLLEVYDRLVTDAEAAGEGGAEPGFPQPDPGGGLGGAPGGDGEESSAPTDSKEDSWGRPQRTKLGDIELRVLVQDEDSKINLLGMLTEDEEQADEHFERVVRVLDLCREETREDIDRSDARRLAETIRTHLKNRRSSTLPKPRLLSDDENDDDLGLPLTLKEFSVLEDFHDGLFRDFRDERGTIVHSIGAFVTVWSSLTTNEELMAMRAEEDPTNAAPEPDPEPDPRPDPTPDPDPTGATTPAPDEEEQAATGGVAVNLNTAPGAVLKSLMDDRDISWRFWDEVIEYRNLEEESEDEEDSEPVLDEYGEEIFQRQIFDSTEELEQVAGWDNLGPEERTALGQLIGTESQVFSIYITARRATGQTDSFGGYRGALRDDDKEDMKGNALVRTVRSVIWRYNDGEAWKLVPIVRWEVLDYTPFEVQDYPDGRR